MDANWKTSIWAIRRAGGSGVAIRATNELVKILGKPVKLREGRSQLFLLSKEALSSRPTLIRVGHDELVVLVAVSDLIEVFLTKQETLGDGLEAMGFKPAKRKPPSVERRKGRPESD